MFTNRFSTIHYIVLFMLIALLAVLLAGLALAIDGGSLQIGMSQVDQVAGLNTCPPRNWGGMYPDIYLPCFTS